jgi:single-strand DNA-binding protein
LPPTIITSKFIFTREFFNFFCNIPFRYESGDWVQRTDWHRVVVFKPQLLESVENYLKKGQRCLVTGKISYGEITDQEGKTRSSTSIIADDVVFFNTQPQQE